MAARWVWKWFSLRIGIGRAFVNNSVKDSSGAATVNHDLDTGSKSYAASIATICLQIPLNKRYQLFVESNGFSWAQDDGDIEYVDGGSSGEESLEDIQGLNILTVGFRFYLKE